MEMNKVVILAKSKENNLSQLLTSSSDLLRTDLRTIETQVGLVILRRDLDTYVERSKKYTVSIIPKGSSEEKELGYVMMIYKNVSDIPELMMLGSFIKGNLRESDRIVDINAFYPFHNIRDEPKYEQDKYMWKGIGTAIMLDLLQMGRSDGAVAAYCYTAYSVMPALLARCEFLRISPNAHLKILETQNLQTCPG